MKNLRKTLIFLAICLVFGASVSALDGIGTKTNPFVIKTTEDYLFFAENVAAGDLGYTAAYAELANCLDFTDKTFLPIGTKAAPFTGSFDGKGHALAGITYETDSPCAGVFACAKNAVITRLGVENASFTVNAQGETNAGILCGELIAASGKTAGISRCYATGSLAVETDGNLRAGGLVGSLKSTEADICAYVQDSYFAGRVDATGTLVYLGGIAGLATGDASDAKLQITRSFSTGALSGVTTKLSTLSAQEVYVGGIAGRLHKDESTSTPWLAATSDISDVFSLCELSAVYQKNPDKALRVSGICAAKMNGTVSNAYVAKSNAVCNLSAEDGTVTDAANFTSRTFLAGELGFDLNAVWMLAEGAETPFLRETPRIEVRTGDAGAVYTAHGAPYGVLLAVLYDEAGRVLAVRTAEKSLALVREAENAAARVFLLEKGTLRPLCAPVTVSAGA